MDSGKIINLCSEWVEKNYKNSVHLIRTGYWVKQLDNKASPELIVACITHDIERAFPENRQTVGSPEDGPGVKWDDPVYNLWHGKRSAEYVGNFLEKNGATEKFIKEVKRLVISHEIGGDYHQNLVKDADCISFLENNAGLFIGRIPEKYSALQVKEKFDYMYNRISLPKAKKLARPFYQKALQALAGVRRLSS
jgi:hypothetical protein